MSRRTTKQPSRDPEARHRSRRRGGVAVLVAALSVMAVALAVVGVGLVRASGDVSTQQTIDGQAQQASSDSSDDADEADDSSKKPVKKTDVVSLTSLMGLSQAQAAAAVGHGATVSATKDVNENGNPVVKEVDLTLAQEPGDAKQGTPTVYLGLDQDGNVVMAGYSAPTSSLGYATLSFADAVTNEHVVERTLTSAGVPVADGTVELPPKSSYSTYGSDGHTLVKERASFNGQAIGKDGKPYDWRAVLVYDYTQANAKGNLANTVRTVYVYINAQ